MSKKTDLIECGRIGRVVGLRGEVLVAFNSGASPVEKGGTLYIEDAASQELSPLEIAALRMQGRSCIVHFEGISTRNQAESIKGRRVFVARGHLPDLPKGHYYGFEIVGLEVFTVGGKKIGTVRGIMSAGHHDVYEVVGEGPHAKEILVPAVDNVVKEIDIKNKRIIIDPLEGMLD